MIVLYVNLLTSFVAIVCLIASPLDTQRFMVRKDFSVAKLKERDSERERERAKCDERQTNQCQKKNIPLYFHVTTNRASLI